VAGCPFTLLLFGGASQLRMLKECLRSVYFGWRAAPDVLLVSDGTVTAEELLEATEWWPGRRRAQTWEESLAHHLARGRVELEEFARTHPMGKKFCVTMAAAEMGPTLYCDTDILWFGGPPDLSDCVGHAMPTIKLTADLRKSYDEELMKAESLERLKQPPWLNAGLCYLHGELYEQLKLAGIVDQANKTGGYFCEQTIMAYAASCLGSKHWKMSEVFLGVEDGYWPVRSNFWGKTWIARHYVGEVRHWFWRDAMALRRRGLK
jgi:hypothetical protein